MTDWSAKAKLTAYQGEDHSVCCERCHAVMGDVRVHMPETREDEPVYFPFPIDGYTVEDGQVKPGHHFSDRLKGTGGSQRRHKRTARYSQLGQPLARQLVASGKLGDFIRSHKATPSEPCPTPGCKNLAPCAQHPQPAHPAPYVESDKAPTTGPAYWRCWNCDGLNVVGDEFWNCATE